MSEKNLFEVAKILVPDGEWETQKRFNYDSDNKRKFYKVDCLSEKNKIVIEYEGPDHYTDVWKSLRDDERKAYFEKRGYSFFRWPYFCQLTRSAAKYFFGEVDGVRYLKALKLVYGVDAEEEIWASGFHTTLNTPSNYTYLGVDRFLSELDGLPGDVKSHVLESLRRYVHDVGDIKLVLGENKLLHELVLNFNSNFKEAVFKRDK